MRSQETKLHKKQRGCSLSILIILLGLWENSITKTTFRRKSFLGSRARKVRVHGGRAEAAGGRAEAREAGGERANLKWWGSPNSMPASRGIPPLESLHYLTLPKQCHWLGTQCSNTQNKEGFLIQNTTSWSAALHSLLTNVQVFLEFAICLPQCVFTPPCDFHGRPTAVF